MLVAAFGFRLSLRQKSKIFASSLIRGSLFLHFNAEYGTILSKNKQEKSND